MKKAKIYIPNKSAMQSGLGKLDKWILEFETNDPTKNPLMGWETSMDTLEEVIIKFSSKEKAIEYAKKNKIVFDLQEYREKGGSSAGYSYTTKTFLKNKKLSDKPESFSKVATSLVSQD